MVMRCRLTQGKMVFVTVNNEGTAHEPVTNFFGARPTPPEQPT
jgi:hypothetical protein